MFNFSDRVHRGAALLDTKCPDWRGKIDPNDSDEVKCILTSLFGDFRTGVTRLQIDAEGAIEYGFKLSPFMAVSGSFEKALREAWVRVLNAESTRY